MGLTRRQFLGGVAVGAGASVAPRSSGAPVEDIELRQPSMDGIHQFANYERQQQQQGNSLTFEETINAVEDWGCDPTGSEPVEPIINDRASDGQMILFPQGQYRCTGPVNPDVTGALGIAGVGYESVSEPPRPGSAAVFVSDAGHPIDIFKVGPLDRGLVANFVIDQRNPQPQGGLLARSSGNVRVRDIRIVGSQTNIIESDTNPCFFTPFAEGEDSLIVFERCVARGGGIPGTKNIGGSPMIGIFGRNGPRGRVVCKDCIIENSSGNGVYGSRTGATALFLGGLYRNSDVSQIRVNGDARIDGCTVVIDEMNYTGLKTKGNANERGPGWPATNGIKLETKPSISKTTGTEVVNCDVRGLSVHPTSRIGSLVHVWDSGGAASFDNCRVLNEVPDTLSFIAEEPGSGNYAAAPKPWAMQVTNCEILGSGAGKNRPAILANGRPNSVVRSTCLHYDGASPSDIEGCSTSGVGYGQNCANAGLRDESKVGASGNLSLPPPNVSITGNGSSLVSRRQRRQQVGNMVSSLLMVMLVVLLIVFAIPLLILLKILAD